MIYEFHPRNTKKGAPKGAFLRREDRIRTCDPLVPNQMRYHLRYFPRAAKVGKVVNHLAVLLCRSKEIGAQNFQQS